MNRPATLLREPESAPAGGPVLPACPRGHFLSAGHRLAGQRIALTLLGKPLR